MNAALGVAVEQAGGHQGPPGVVDAYEEDLGHFGDESSLDLDEGAQALAGEPLAELTGALPPTTSNSGM